MSDEAATTDGTKPTSHVNDQVTDAVHEAMAAIEAGATAFAESSACQMVTQCIGLAMQNAVAHQQRMDVIYGAMVTAAAKEVVGRPDAESLDVLTKVLATTQDSDRLAQQLGLLSKTLAQSLHELVPVPETKSV